MSTHEVKVIKVDNVLPHPNADKLDLINIWGYTCVVRKGLHKPGDLLAYIEPDFTVPLDRPEFSFLKKEGSNKTRERITVRRFRGVYSSGLLIPAPQGSKEGDNVMDLLGVERYEPPLNKMTGATHGEKGPELPAPKYDLENVLKYGHCLKEGEDCILTAKLHGSNSRFCWYNDRMYCGSRNMWKMKPGTVLENGDVVQDNAWWKALEQNPWIEEFCKQNPGVVLYGEVVGCSVQGNNFHYGHKPNEIGFYVFDILENGRWIPNQEFKKEKYSILKFVPTVYEGPYDLNIVKKLAEEKETFNNANHIREGIVIKVTNERIDYKIGRVALKYVSNKYLEKKK